MVSMSMHQESRDEFILLRESDQLEKMTCRAIRNCQQNFMEGRQMDYIPSGSVDL